MKSIIVTVCGVLCAAVMASAQSLVGTPTLTPAKVAFVDLRRVATESIEGKAAATKLQTLTQQKSAELEGKTKALLAAQQALEKTGQGLSDPEREKTQKDVERLNLEIERFKQDARAEIQNLQQQLLLPLQDKIRPVLDVLIKELGIQVLFSRADVAAFLVDVKLDITPELIKRFDLATGKPAPSTKP
jgi:outer membrane protein